MLYLSYASSLLILRCVGFSQALLQQRQSSVGEIHKFHKFIADEDVASTCNESEINVFMQGFQREFHRAPKVAVLVAEDLRFPARQNQRIDRWAEKVLGADVFIATDPASVDKIRFLPKAKQAGVFNHTFLDSLEASGCWKGKALHQLLRTGDALKLVFEQEKLQGWEYDVVARIRTEAVHFDQCRVGPDQGCNKAGMWQKAMAASSLAEDAKRKIYVQHDRSYWGRRHDMKELFKQIESYITDRMQISFTRRPISDDSAKFPMYELYAPSETQVDCSEIPGEETLHVVARQIIGFSEIVMDRQMDIRRFGCDYSESEGVTDRRAGHPVDYAIGCKHYPQVTDATEHKCTG